MNSFHLIPTLTAGPRARAHAWLVLMVTLLAVAGLATVDRFAADDAPARPAVETMTTTGTTVPDATVPLSCPWNARAHAAATSER